MQSVSQVNTWDRAPKRGADARQVHQKHPIIELRCPVCGNAISGVPYEVLAREQVDLQCEICSFQLRQEEGIWHALPLDRQRYFAKFLKEYQEVRNAEGRGSDRAEFYLALPYIDLSERNSWQWKIRARTYRYIVRNILKNLNGAIGSSLSILDLGAGNGWLSYRLACLGHKAIAVDLITNTWDGLGAAQHYRAVLPEFFPRFQAELDHLPFTDGQFDCAIFNASFHYSERYESTLAEAIRCVRPGGTIIISDTPTYHSEESGRRMVIERQELFQTKFGFKSDGMASCEFLTRERLTAMEAEFGIEWRAHRVWYGFRWAMRPWLARLRRRREPSRFQIYTARVREL
jgi:SAM-dependent methyltransferase